MAPPAAAEPVAATTPPTAANGTTTTASGDLVVVTLNTWGLLGLSKQREARVSALCDWLADPLRHQRPPAPENDTSAKQQAPSPPFAAPFWQHRPIDVVLLQEVWVSSDAARLMSAARKGGLLHSVHFCSGAFGSGLITLSRFPVLAARLHIYSSKGDPCAVFSGDFFASKGVGWCRLAVPGVKDPVHVFNTHLCSNYKHTFRPLPLLPQEEAGGVEALRQQAAGRGNGRGALGRRVSMAIECGDSGVRVPTDADAPTRLAQVLELCDFVQEVSGLGLGGGCGGGGGEASGAANAQRPPLVVLGGDLNSEPDTLEVALLRARLGPELADAWAETAGWRADAFAAAAADADGAAAAVDAGHTCRSALCSYAPRRQVPERIDYVWTTLAPRAAALDLARVPGAAGGHSFSDHLAVRAALALGGERAAVGAAGAAEAGSAAAAARPASSGVASLLLRRARGGGAGDAKGGAAAATTPTTTSEKKPDQASVARAALVGAAVVLAEGAEEFAGLASGNTLLGGLLLVSTLYTAVALPLLIPDLARWLVASPLSMAACALALALCGAGGFALFVAGFFASRSQQNALVMALRSHVLRMRRMGLVPE